MYIDVISMSMEIAFSYENVNLLVQGTQMFSVGTPKLKLNR